MHEAVDLTGLECFFYDSNQLAAAGNSMLAQ
jgi:hypothetical protein